MRRSAKSVPRAVRGAAIAVALSLGLPFGGVIGCSASYVLRQAAGQVELLARAEPVERVLAAETTRDSVRRGLDEIGDVLDFARANGFDVGLAYQTFSDIGDRPIVYVITACPPDLLVLYKWKFPVLGPVPYKGFFDRSAARRMRDRMLELGYETRVGAAAAYSTLGWFPDPIVPSFLEGAIGERVDLVLHELTHRTLFLDGDVGFNESLATFVARECTIRYLTQRFGAESEELEAYLRSRRDRGRIADQVKRVLRDLQAAFTNPSREDRIQAKEERLAQFVRDLAAVEFETEGYRQLREQPWQLPDLLAFDLYTGDEPALAEAWAAAGEDLTRLVPLLQRADDLRKSGESVWPALERLLLRGIRGDSEGGEATGPRP